jgi:hypothetical protein
MELVALYKRVIGLDVHQAQITACARAQVCTLREHLLKLGVWLGRKPAHLPEATHRDVPNGISSPDHWVRFADNHPL